MLSRTGGYETCTGVDMTYIVAIVVVIVAAASSKSSRLRGAMAVIPRAVTPIAASSMTSLNGRVQRSHR